MCVSVCKCVSVEVWKWEEPTDETGNSSHVSITQRSAGERREKDERSGTTEDEKTSGAPDKRTTSQQVDVDGCS